MSPRSDLCQQVHPFNLYPVWTYGWEKVLVRNRQDDAEVDDGVEPRERILACEANAFPGSTFVVFCKTTRGDLHAVLGHLSHLGGEVRCAVVVRVVGDSPEADDANKYTKAA